MERHRLLAALIVFATRHCYSGGTIGSGLSDFQSPSLHHKNQSQQTKTNSISGETEKINSI